MADEKERFHRALDFMKMLGISQSVVAPVLRRLIKLYDNDWSLIEDENYRALADSYFDQQECKESNLCPRVTRNSARRIAANEASPRRSYRQKESVSNELKGGNDNAFKESQAPLLPSTQKITGYTIKESDTPFPPTPLKNNCNSVRCEAKLVQPQSSPIKRGLVKQEELELPRTTACKSSAYSFQLECLTYHEDRINQGVKEKCQEATYERQDSIEKSKMSVKRPRMEASSLPNTKQKQMPDCRIESSVPNLNFPLRVKDEPIELPQLGLVTPVPPPVSAGILCLWGERKHDNLDVKVEKDAVHTRDSGVESEQRRIDCGGKPLIKKFSSPAMVATHSASAVQTKKGNDALSQIASTYSQTSDEEVPSALDDSSLHLNQKDVYATLPASSPSSSRMIVVKQEEAAPIPDDRTLVFNRKDVYTPFPSSSSPSSSRMVVVKQEEAVSFPNYRTHVLNRKDVDAPFPFTSFSPPSSSQMIVEREKAATSVPYNKTLIVNRKDIYASVLSSSSPTSRMLVKLEEACLDTDMHDSKDISRGQEAVPITMWNDLTNEKLPRSFHYISKNITFQDAYVNFSLARIGEEDCCETCNEDCLQRYPPCHCARETGGEFAYNAEGRLQTSFLEEALADKRDVESSSTRTKYCDRGLCMLERGKPCKGHLIRKFIKECWTKCQCKIQCGNRVVQKGIQHKLQVFLTSKRKGWGVRTLEDLPAGTFVCEYVGEILTNMELDIRNNARKGHSNHYPVLLDSDWSSETMLKDEELLCLDATHYGNVARFINHRCYDANLVDIPVEIESPDHHYYHIAFFTTRAVKALEELTWDYCIDFEDKDHPIKAFRCFCESRYCRGNQRKV